MKTIPVSTFTNEYFKELLTTNWDIDYCLLVHLPGGRAGGGVGFLVTVSSVLTGSTLWPLFNFGFLFFFLLFSIPNRKKALHILQLYLGNILDHLIQLLGWDTSAFSVQTYTQNDVKCKIHTTFSYRK